MDGVINKVQGTSRCSDTMDDTLKPQWYLRPLNIIIRKNKYLLYSDNTIILSDESSVPMRFESKHIYGY